MASELQMDATESAKMTHPTRGRRRKVKGPLAGLPRLPFVALHRLDTSSEEPEEERVQGQDSKRLIIDM